MNTPISSGINAQKISGVGINNERVVGVYQLIKVNANESFILNGQLNIESLNNAKVQLYVEFYSDPNHIVSVYATDYNKLTNGSFKTLEITGTIPTTATFAKVNILLRAIADGASGTFYADSMGYYTK
ncbi:hypothetical protein D3C75_857530 [compost metagenome]